MGNILTNTMATLLECATLPK